MNNFLQIQSIVGQVQDLMSNFNNGTQIGSILMEDCNQVDTKLNGMNGMDIRVKPAIYLIIMKQKCGSHNN